LFWYISIEKAVKLVWYSFLKHCPSTASVEISFKFLVILLFSVSRANILGDRDVLVQQLSDINLTCRAEESPEPLKRVIWYRNSIPVDSLLSRGGISVITESRKRSSNLLVIQDQKKKYKKVLTTIFRGYFH